MAEGVWKGVYSQVFERSCQILLNKFFYSSTSSMRKACDGEKKKRRKEKKKKKRIVKIAVRSTIVVPVNCLNSDRLERQPLVPIEVYGDYLEFLSYCLEVLELKIKSRTADVVRNVCKQWVHLYFLGHHFLFSFHSLVVFH